MTKKFIQPKYRISKISKGYNSVCNKPYFYVRIGQTLLSAESHISLKDAVNQAVSIALLRQSLGDGTVRDYEMCGYDD